MSILLQDELVNLLTFIHFTLFDWVEYALLLIDLADACD